MAKKILVALGALGAIALIPLALLAQPGARSILVSENDPGLKKPDYGTSTGQTATPTGAGVFGETFGLYEPRPPVFVKRGTMVVARSEFDQAVERFEIAHAATCAVSFAGIDPPLAEQFVNVVLGSDGGLQGPCGP